MIEIKNLTQIYASKKGIFDVSFTVKKGEVFGYLGPNGAGKTTTIRGILGQMNINEGYIRINDLDPRVDIVKINKLIGYLPGEMAFFDHYTGKQFLDFICKMRKLEDFSKRENLNEMFELDTKGLIKKMSKGMKQKLGIVAAFMHDPDILILDEPTSGLDPLMQNKFLELILSEKKKGKTILMSSHIFEEVERVCDRAGIIKEGRMIAIEDFSEKEKKVADIYLITLKKPNDKLLSSGLDVIKKNDTVYQISVKDNYKEFLKTLSTYDVIHIDHKKQSIEDIFMTYYGGHQHD
ncbi:MAG: ABC transporter ATP-binding protein [Acholeplasmataceae bacterium]